MKFINRFQELCSGLRKTSSFEVGRWRTALQIRPLLSEPTTRPLA